MYKMAFIFQAIGPARGHQEKKNFYNFLYFCIYMSLLDFGMKEKS